MKKIISGCIYLCFFMAIILLLRQKYSTYSTRKEVYDIEESYQNIVASDMNSSSTVNKIEVYQNSFQNDDIIARLIIPGTTLDTLVVQAKDNEYYLNHLLDKRKNDWGSIFLDYRNQMDDERLIIYGHNSETLSTEFNLLEKFLEKNYYQKHREIRLELANTTRNYEIVGVVITTTDDHINFQNNQELITWLKENNQYETPVLDDKNQFLILQTCYYEPENSYLLLVARRK